MAGLLETSVIQTVASRHRVRWRRIDTYRNVFYVPYTLRRFPIRSLSIPQIVGLALRAQRFLAFLACHTMAHFRIRETATYSR